MRNETMLNETLINERGKGIKWNTTVFMVWTLIHVRKQSEQERV